MIELVVVVVAKCKDEAQVQNMLSVYSRETMFEPDRNADNGYTKSVIRLDTGEKIFERS